MHLPPKHCQGWWEPCDRVHCVLVRQHSSLEAVYINGTRCTAIVCNDPLNLLNSQLSPLVGLGIVGWALPTCDPHPAQEIPEFHRDKVLTTIRRYFLLDPPICEVLSQNLDHLVWVAGGNIKLKAGRLPTSILCLKKHLGDRISSFVTC